MENKLKQETYTLSSLECEKRRKVVANTMALVLTATEGPTQSFKNALDQYVAGNLSLEELERRTEQMEYLEA